jgi:hypothetical protein
MSEAVIGGNVISRQKVNYFDKNLTSFPLQIPQELSWD